MCHTARQVRGGAGAGASLVIAAESVRPVPNPSIRRPVAGNKTMKTETNETTGRDGITCTLKPHRLICINPPGSVTGPRTKKRSARAAEQEGRTAGQRRARAGAAGKDRRNRPGREGRGRSGRSNRIRTCERGRWSPMTRGHPPWVAIGEALRKAKAQGHLVFALEPAGELPVHFVTVDGDCISLVRVRRLKYPGYTVEEIEASCKKDIAELRSITVTAEIFRELRVRGPDWHLVPVPRAAGLSYGD